MFLGLGILMKQDSTNTVQPSGKHQKLKIQDGGLQTENVYVFTSRIDGNAIPTAIPMF